MARELKLVSWCDGNHEEDVPATIARTLAVDGQAPILLDLCEPCDKVVQDVMHLMDAGVPAKRALTVPSGRKGRPPGGTPTPAAAPKPRADGTDRTDCQDCDYDGNTRGALGQHIQQKHNKKLSDYDWTRV